jgi:hypothetical protein
MKQKNVEARLKIHLLEGKTITEKVSRIKTTLK